MRGTSSISCADWSALGTGTSRIEIRRDAVAEKELEEERTMERRAGVVRVLGMVLGGMDWKRSGYLESVRGGEKGYMVS